MEQLPAAMLAAKRSAGVAPEVNLCMPPPSANQAAHSGFETQRRRHQKSKTGVSVAPQKGLVSAKNFFFQILLSFTDQMSHRTGGLEHRFWTGSLGTSIITVYNLRPIHT